MMVRGIMAGSEESMFFPGHAAFGILVLLRDVFFLDWSQAIMACFDANELVHPCG
jgi:hypothetical protein